MADRKPAAPSSGTAEHAMNRVLAAERDAGQAVADCEAQARDVVQAARQDANRIASRTNERITLMQMRCAQRSAETLKRLEQAQQSPADQANKPLDDTSLSACMDNIAEALTSAAGSSVNKRDTGK